MAAGVEVGKEEVEDKVKAGKEEVKTKVKQLTLEAEFTLGPGQVGTKEPKKKNEINDNITVDKRTETMHERERRAKENELNTGGCGVCRP